MSGHVSRRMALACHARLQPMETLCAIDGCEQPRRGREWCKRHYNRWYREGDPLAPGRKAVRAPACTVDGCERPHTGLGLCMLHYHRQRRGVSLDGPQHARRYVDGHGYVRLWLPTHPTAQADSYASEHRVVLYDAIGPGEHACYWCGTAVTWFVDRRDPRSLCVDHLDNDKANNDRANLRPSCGPCNRGRGRCPKCNPQDRSIALSTA